VFPRALSRVSFATKGETARTLILDLLEVCRAKGIRGDCQGIQGTDRDVYDTVDRYPV